MLCRKCGRPIDPAFAFCPLCGQRQKQGHAWYYNPVWVVVLALFVLGPFVLPLVWRSAHMDRAAKIALTAGILVYTAITLYYFFQVVTYEFRVIGELNELL